MKTKLLPLLIFLFLCLPCWAGQYYRPFAQGRVGQAGGLVWTPSNTTVAAWYDGAQFNNGGVTGVILSTWSDLSGNGRAATNVGTTIKGYADGSKGYVNFNSAFSEHLVLPSSVMPALSNTEYVVVHVQDSAYNKVVFSRAYNYGALYMWFNSSEQFCYAVNGTTVVATPSCAGLDMLITARYDGSTVSVWANGSLTTNVTAALGTPSYNVNDVASIGAFRNTAGGFASTFDGSIRSLIVTHQAQDTATRQRMEGYLAWRWGMQTNLPSDHPWRYGAPTQ